ncbi:DUF4142 domain-containing protein [Pleurocapsales cyanobacterium LEGE 06147]|nr:DUF4142 domain-containing protein [Pleurocapsales cyanobacterium LEGE 06147]
MPEGITLPNEISEQDRNVMDRLSELSGAEFDRQYMQHMVEAHTKDVSMYQRQAEQGEDPELKAFAAETVPILQEHLQLARSISENLTQSNP